VCEKFQIAREKVVVTVTATFKSHHRHIQSCTYGSGDFPAFIPAEAGTRLSDPGGMQG